MGTQQLLIPLKFLALAFHLVATTMLFFTYPDNIKAALPQVTSHSDALFVAAKLSVLFACSLTVVLLSIELVIHLSGNNLFRERHNAIVTALHLLGILMYSQFSFASWNYYNMWYLFIVFSLLPFLMEVATSISSGLKYRRWN